VSARDLLQAPRLSLPALAVAAGALFTWTATLVLLDRGALAVGWAAALATAAAFCAFTPLHEAAHRSIARARWVNAIVGRLAAIPLVGPFPAFRYVHLEHHRHTNEPGLDPDHWAGQPPAWLRPLPWLTQDVRYYVYIAARWRTRSSAELAETVGVLAACALIAATGVAAGHARVVVWGWLVPARLALALLACSFDWLPHRPHEVPARVDPCRATHVMTDAVLTPLFLYQNYHLVHHLYPGVPFHRYARIWRAQKEELIARGAEDRRLFARE